MLWSRTSFNWNISSSLVTGNYQWELNPENMEGYAPVSPCVLLEEEHFFWSYTVIFCLNRYLRGPISRYNINLSLFFPLEYSMYLSFFLGPIRPEKFTISTFAWSLVFRGWFMKGQNIHTDCDSTMPNTHPKWTLDYVCGQFWNVIPIWYAFCFQNLAKIQSTLSQYHIVSFFNYFGCRDPTWA